MDGGKPQRQPFGSYNHAGMHLQATDHIMLRKTVAVLLSEGPVRDPDRRHIATVVGERGGVVQNQ